MVRTVSELREIIGEAGELAKNKVISHLDENSRQFIKQSPFLVLSTMDQWGACDASPRGDHPGFVHIIDSNRLIIPERRGNKRLDSIQNILTQPAVGLLFIIPGMGETLRVNGQAYITKDKAYLEEMKVQGKAPVLGIGVEVNECFIHCGKAFKRSKLWEPEHWLKKEELPSAPKIMAAHANMQEVTEASIEKRLKEGYIHRLY
ncbi:pyridoxamine 5'-phosphate oxidase family protein [Halobacillus salinarum]|uniref:Pyridoxamine 5'-phosphate oxidase family protein n=1 Tax=Halobacillus salinarum TaxID=2932257 RepID=A0ABY4EQZ8_9BACI|nr:pyridoxamine 5'-phosphate oxidase family protein [Halobacillus salinarum]UOQ46400.1 pyridoxamine 5'-phosphate oxidase family protein [Halobacillus salinarum]